MKGQMIDFQANGGSYKGYLAVPQDGGPGVIVIQEWWGLNEHIMDVCDRFASEGFSSLAPDLYKGEKTTSPDEAGKLMMALNIQETDTILRGAAKNLLQNEACKSQTVGVIGFCMGGQLALYAAAANPDLISACVNFYGIHPNVNPPYEKMKAPVLGLFAEKDSFVNAAAISSLKSKLEKAGVPHDLHTYPGVNHGFFNDTRPVYHQISAEDAWIRTLSFLRQNVR